MVIMYTEVKTIIKERIEAGNSKDEVVAELHEAGYPTDLALQLYTETVGKPEEETAMPAFKLETEKSEVTTVIESSPSPSLTPTSTSASYHSQSKKSFLMPTVVGLLTVFLVSGVVYGAMTGGFAKVGDYFSSLFDKAPYATESEMMAGMITSMTQLKSYSFNTDYEIKFEPRASSTPILNEEIKSHYTSDIDEIANFMPTSGYGRFGMAGLVDIRNKDNPEIDLDMSFNMLYEPIALNLGGGVRVADGNVYGRVNNFPEMYKQFMPFELPIGTWILLHDTGEGSFINDMPLIPGLNMLQVLNATSSPLATLSGEQKEKIREVFAVLQSLGETGKLGQLASVASSQMLETGGLTPEQEEMKNQIVLILKQYPIFKFVGKPEKKTVNDEAVFNYNLDIDYDNVLLFGQELIGILGKHFDAETKDLEKVKREFLAEFPTRENLEIINRLLDFSFAFRADGSLQGVYIGGVVTPSREAKGQINLRYETTFGRQNDALDIAIPDSIYEKSLEQLLEPSRQEARNRSLDASVKYSLSNMRSQAQISYNKNDFNYLQVCENMKEKFTAVEFQCADAKDKYMIYAQLPSNKNFFCIDSAGVRMETSIEPELKNLKCPPSSVSKPEVPVNIPTVPRP